MIDALLYYSHTVIPVDALHSTVMTFNVNRNTADISYVCGDKYNVMQLFATISIPIIARYNMKSGLLLSVSGSCVLS